MKWSHHILIHASHSAEGWALWKSPIVWFDRVQLRALPLSCSCWPERTGARPRTAGMWRWAMTGFLSLSLMFCPPLGAKRVMWDVREHNDSLTCTLWRSKHALDISIRGSTDVYGPFFFLSCFECTSQTTLQVFVVVCFSALWLQRLLFRMRAMSTCSAAWSASIAQPLYVSEPWGWPPALTNSPARFSFQDGFPRRTSATVTCGLFSIKYCCFSRLAVGIDLQKWAQVCYSS